MKKKNGRNKNKIRLNRFPHIFGLIMLVAAAFMLPQLIFAAGDRELMNSVGQGQRTGINFAALEENYEAMLNERLSNFAAGCKRGDAYYVSEVAHDLSDKEKTVIINNALGESPVWLIGQLEEEYNLYFQTRASDLIEFKKYIIYDSENVSFICWYADVLLKSAQELKMLIDAEDGTVYYVQGIRHKQYKYLKDYNKTATDFAAIAYMETDAVVIIGVILKQYFDCDFLKELDTEIIESAWEYSPVENYYWVIEQLEQEAAMRGMKPSELLTDSVLKDVEIDENSLSMPLVYGENTLEFELNYDLGLADEFNNKPNFAIGISGMADLVPGIKM